MEGAVVTWQTVVVAGEAFLFIATLFWLSVKSSAETNRGKALDIQLKEIESRFRS